MNLKVLTLILVFIGAFAGAFSGMLAYQVLVNSNNNGTGDNETGFTFMKTEELKIIGNNWGAGTIILSVKNTGTDSISVTGARVNDVPTESVTYGGSFYGSSHTLIGGAQGTITIAQSFTSGVKYEFEVVSATGNKYTYVATAP